MRPSSLLPALALALALLPAGAAYAGQVEVAEHQRISEELRKLAQRGNWSAVNDQFRALEALEARGEPITPKEFELGAEAARAAGDIANAVDRLRRGARAGGTPEIIAALEDLEARFGPARVTVDPKYIADRTLAADSPPMAPDERAAIEFANKALTSGSFEGLLPKGLYSVGGKTFAATPGGAAEGVILAPAPGGAVRTPGEPFKLAWAGPRVSVGVAYTQAGAASTQALAKEGYQAVPFGGVGARAGLGMDVGLTKSFGLVAMVGYHGLYGGGTDAALSGDDGGPVVGAVPGDAMHLGYGWLGATLRAGDFAVSVGPEWGIGAARVLGVEWPCAQDTLDCGGAGSLTQSSAAGQRVAGSVTAGGGAGSIGYGFLPVGGLRGGLALEGGALTDGARWYPWGELALTLSPAVRRN